MAATAVADDLSTFDREQSVPATRTLLATLVLIVLAATNVPLFLRMPLATDAVLYDMEASVVAAGAVPYQDFFETNLPGAMWIHGGVRALFGPSWFALRAFDLSVVTLIVVLLVRWLKPLVPASSDRLWTAVLMFAFYLSISEWCHAQRDTWALLPVLAAMYLRARQVTRIERGPSTLWILALAAVEGLCWGAAVWIKPMIALPAAACWITSAIIVRRPGRASVDFLGLLLGGAAIGAAGIGWLWHVGAWPAFVETLTSWNPEYFASRTLGWAPLRVLQTVWRLFPWALLHLIAVPVAVMQLARGLRSSSGEERPIDTTRALLAALYLGWLAQSLFLQHMFDYVHVPGVLLALTVLSATRPLERRGSRRAVLAFLIVFAATTTLFRGDRLAAWKEAIRGPSTTELTQRLALLKQVDWPQLDRVAGFLAAQNVGSGQVTCFNSTLVYLYPQLGLLPSTRYAYLDCTLLFCPGFAPQVSAEWQASPQRFLVLDLFESGLPAANVDDPAFGVLQAGEYPGLPNTGPQAPIFRAGRYAVYAVGDETAQASQPGVTFNSIRR